VEFTTTPRWKLVGAPIDAVIEARHHVGEADRIDVEHPGRLGIVAHDRRIARRNEEIAQPHGVRPQQVRLHPEQVPVAARVVQEGLDAGALLDQDRGGQRAGRRAHPGRVGHIDRIDAANLQRARLVDERAAVVSLGRLEFGDGDEGAASQGVRQARLLFARQRGRRGRMPGRHASRRDLRHPHPGSGRARAAAPRS
jgi:hypothetical protein